MSLKAKIEAVIYAAEEPVTLTQIVGLFGQEAEADLDRQAANQHQLPLAAEKDAPPPPSKPDLLNEEILATRELPPPPVPATPSETARLEKERAKAVRAYLQETLDQLVRDYATPGRGLEIREVAGGFRLATKPEYHDAVRGFVKSLKPPLKLSLQALETLAVVAYKQPVTAPEVSEIRGVDSGGVLGSLLTRKLVTTAGRKQVIGRPILYKTTKDFLLRFGLRDIGELPSIEEFERMAGELESEPIQEEIPMPQGTSPHSSPGNSITGANLEEEREATEPQADGDGSTVDTEVVDARLSGITPNDHPVHNPSAEEAEVQRESRD